MMYSVPSPNRLPWTMFAVREKIAMEGGGDIKKHIEETNRIGEELRAKLKVRLAPARSNQLIAERETGA